jgi:hypothetical protein
MSMNDSNDEIEDGRMKNAIAQAAIRQLMAEEKVPGYEAFGDEVHAHLSYIHIMSHPSHVLDK